MLAGDGCYFPLRSKASIQLKSPWQKCLGQPVIKQHVSGSGIWAIRHRSCQPSRDLITTSAFPTQTTWVTTSRIAIIHLCHCLGILRSSKKNRTNRISRSDIPKKQSISLRKTRIDPFSFTSHIQCRTIRFSRHPNLLAKVRMVGLVIAWKKSTGQLVKS